MPGKQTQAGDDKKLQTRRSVSNFSNSIRASACAWSHRYSHPVRWDADKYTVITHSAITVDLSLMLFKTYTGVFMVLQEMQSSCLIWKHINAKHLSDKVHEERKETQSIHLDVRYLDCKRLKHLFYKSLTKNLSLNNLVWISNHSCLFRRRELQCVVCNVISGYLVFLIGHNIYTVKEFLVTLLILHLNRSGHDRVSRHALMRFCSLWRATAAILVLSFPMYARQQICREQAHFEHALPYTQIGK